MRPIEQAKLATSQGKNYASASNEGAPELCPLTPQEFARAEIRLRNPSPGSSIEAAKKHGIDLTLLIEQLRLTPSERVRRMHLLGQISDRARRTAHIQEK